MHFLQPEAYYFTFGVKGYLHLPKNMNVLLYKKQAQPRGEKK